jgi:hypothetical protein
MEYLQTITNIKKIILDVQIYMFQIEEELINLQEQIDIRDSLFLPRTKIVSHVEWI